jgi:hypothetical protein
MEVFQSLLRQILLSPWNGHTGPDGSGTIVNPHPQYYVWPPYHYNDNNWWRRLNRYGLLAHGYGEDDIIWPKDPDTGEWLLPRDNVVLGMPGYFYQNGQNESFIDSPYHCPYQSEILTDWIKDLSKEVFYTVEDQGELNGEYQFRVALSNRLNYTSWASDVNIPLARDPLTISSGGYGDFPGILAGTDSSHPEEYSICGQGARYTDLSDDACVLDTVCSDAVSWYRNMELEAVYSGVVPIPIYTVNLDNQWYYVNQRSSPIYNNVNFTPGIAGSHGPCGLHVPTLKFWRKGTPKIDADPIDYSSGDSGYMSSCTHSPIGCCNRSGIWVPDESGSYEQVYNSTVVGSNENYNIMHPCLSCGAKLLSDDYDAGFCSNFNCVGNFGCCSNNRCCEGGYEWEIDFWSACDDLFNFIFATQTQSPTCGESSCGSGDGPGLCSAGLAGNSQEEPPPGASD